MRWAHPLVVETVSADGALRGFSSTCQASEGIDFADQHARGVILLGIPFPAVKDTKVGPVVGSGTEAPVSRSSQNKQCNLVTHIDHRGRRPLAGSKHTYWERSV